MASILLRRLSFHSWSRRTYRTVSKHIHAAPQTEKRLASQPGDLDQTDEYRTVHLFKVTAADTRKTESEWNRQVAVISNYIPQYSLKSISVILHACRLRGNCSPEFLKLLLVETTVRLGSESTIDPVDAATIASSMSNLFRSQSGVFSKALKKEIKNVALSLTEAVLKPEIETNMSDRVVSTLLGSLGMVFKTESPAATVSNERLARCVKHLTLEVCSEHRLVSFSQQGLAVLFTAYANLRWQSSAVMLRLSQEVVNRIGGFKSDGIAAIMLACSKLRYSNERLIITVIVEAAGPHMASILSETELCNLIYSVGRLAIPSEFIKKIQPAVDRLLTEARRHNRLRNYRPVDYATLLPFLCQYNEYVGLRPVVRSFAEEITKRFATMVTNIETLPKHVATILHSSVRLGIYDEALIQAVKELILSGDVKWDSTWSVTLIVWSLASHQALTPDIFNDLCGRLQTMRRDGQILSQKSWMQFAYGIHYLQRAGIGFHVDPESRQLMEEALSVATVEDIRGQYTQASKHPF